MSTEIKLSIVATSRNDNHGQEMNKRMRMFVRGLIHQCNKFKLRAELIIVEWNPPAENELLHTILPQPQAGDYLTLRYIVVPNEIHNQYRFAQSIPLYQMIAKNVGIRRAQSNFILCTNVDILFSDELMRHLAEGKLDTDKFYRANRCDIPSAIDENASVEQQLKYCESNIIRRLGYNSQLQYMVNWPKWIYSYNWLATMANQAARIRQELVTDPYYLSIVRLDTNACGDFTLMHKDMWMNIEGYPELDLYSIHIDSMALIAAKTQGYSQFIFPMDACAYHIDHYIGWESLNPIDKIAFINQRPGIGWDVVLNAGEEMFKTKRKYGFNKPDWGFANLSLQEIAFNSAE